MPPISNVGIDACVFHKFPQPGQRLFLISIKRAAADAPEFPTGSAQLGLTVLVILPFFVPWPSVSVALDGDAAVLSLHDQIDPVLRVSRKRAKLRDDGIGKTYAEGSKRSNGLFHWSSSEEVGSVRR